jgi:hypothetical protein
LNLVVTDPNGQRYNGNVYEEVCDSIVDTANNVEVVLINNLTVGTYKIEVIGSNIEEGNER